MPKSFADQLGELQLAARALPGIKAEIRKIESSIASINRLLGGQPAGKPGGPPKRVARRIRRAPSKKIMGLKQKITAALAGGPKTAAELAKVDKRANPKSLAKWASQGLLMKDAKGRFSKP
jgi:hypothetical protein